MPKVSVIVPVDNAEKYLQECVESIPLLRMYTRIYFSETEGALW